MNKEAKKYAYEINPVGCVGTDCGNACTNTFCNKDINDAYLAGGLRMKERAIEAFKEFVSDYCHESGRIDISNNSDHYIRVFMDKINNMNYGKNRI